MKRVHVKSGSVQWLTKTVKDSAECLVVSVPFRQLPATSVDASRSFLRPIASSSSSDGLQSRSGQRMSGSDERLSALHRVYSVQSGVTYVQSSNCTEYICTHGRTSVLPRDTPYLDGSYTNGPETRGHVEFTGPARALQSGTEAGIPTATRGKHRGREPSCICYLGRYIPTYIRSTYVLRMYIQGSDPRPCHPRVLRQSCVR